MSVPITQHVQTLCGFYTLHPGDGLSSYWCASNVPCAIDTAVTPNVIGCAVPTSGTHILNTTFFNYNRWPVGGCSQLQYCCPSEWPIVQTMFYDGGATLHFLCETTSDLISAATQTDGLSIQLAVINRDPGPITTPTLGTKTTDFYSTSSSITSSSAAPITITSPFISAPSTSPLSSSSSSLPRTNDSSSSSNTNGLNTGGIIGIVIALSALIVGLPSAYLAWRKCWRGQTERKQHVQADVVELRDGA